MTPEDRVVCLFTRQDLAPDHIEQALTINQRHPIHWDAVCRTARQQGVSPLVYANAVQAQKKGLEIPPNAFASLKKDYIRNVFVKKGTAETLEKAITFLAQKGIDLMLVKGAALDLLVYDRPWYTVMGDVDLVLKVEKSQLFHSELEEIQGFFDAINNHKDSHRVHFEYDFYEHHDVTMNGMLSIDPERIWRDAVQVRFKEQNVWVMSKEDMLTAGAVNSCRKRFFRLKSILDISSMVGKFSDLDWDAFTNKTRDYGCQTIVFTALTVARMAVGCSIPSGALENFGMNPVRAFTIRRLARLLLRYRRLDILSLGPDVTPEWKRPSWGLLLTYATFQPSHLQSKIRQLLRAWYNQKNTA